VGHAGEARLTLRLDGHKTYLLPFEERHLEDPRYFQWLTDLEVMRFIGRDEYLKPIPFERVRQYVHDVWASPYISFFAVHSQTNDLFIGTAKLNYLDQSGLSHRSADVGIMIGDRGCWGSGMATDALRTICRYAFDTLGARKLTAGAIADNNAVIKAFMRIGFVQEGRVRQKVFLAGGYADHVLLGCLRGELRTLD
jgi:ribosomal-protein-alanine N-acetyltransferase